MLIKVRTIIDNSFALGIPDEICFGDDENLTTTQQLQIT